MEAAKSAYPLDSTRIIECQLNVEALEEGLGRLQQLEAELFGSESKSSIASPAAGVQSAPLKKSKAVTEAGKARAAAAGYIVDEKPSIETES